MAVVKLRAFDGAVDEVIAPLAARRELRAKSISAALEDSSLDVLDVLFRCSLPQK